MVSCSKFVWRLDTIWVQNKFDWEYREGIKMEERKITDTQIQSFYQYLIREEKSRATVEKYLRDVRAFDMYAGEQIISKEVVMAWKKELQIKEYAVRSINSMLASLNSLLDYLGWSDCKVKSIKQQRQIYCAEEKELSRAEYMRLLEAAQKKPQLQLVMKTICGTGIRVSELKFFTVENVKQGEVTVNCKAKSRTVLIPGKLRKLLLDYSRKEKIHSGVIFINRNGEPLNRSCIWAQMKSLCEEAGVNPGKVFPHNLRKLFARTFYGIEKDIAKLADILGHSSIDTTRIYIMTTGTEHRRIIERLGLVV